MISLLWCSQFLDSVLNVVALAIFSNAAPELALPSYHSSLVFPLFIPFDIWVPFTPVVGLNSLSQLDLHPAVAHVAQERDLTPPADSDSSAPVLSLLPEPETSVSDRIGALIAGEKKAVDTVQLRRSTRSTRFDGFKTSLVSDVRLVTSKVKHHQAPSIGTSSTATDPSTGLHVIMNDASESDPPPNTPIRTIQMIGSHVCGIPTDDLSAEKLMAKRDKPPHQA